MSKKRRIAIVIDLLLLLATLIFIFGNSLKNVDQSKNDSQHVTHVIGNLPPVQQAIEKEVISEGILEETVRSLAHFFEFAVLGTEIMMLIFLLQGSCHIKYYLFVVLICFILGLTDEIIQSFNDRATEAIDVVKDVLGSAFGAFCIYIISILIKKKRKIQ